MLVNVMVSMTLSIPAELKKRMAKHPEVRWSEVARTAIRRQLDEWDELERFFSKSKLTEKDIRPIVKKVEQDMAKHFRELTHAARR